MSITPKMPTINELMVSAMEGRNGENAGLVDALIIIAAELRAIRYALTPEQNDDRTAESGAAEREAQS